MSHGHIGTGAEMSGHLGTSLMVWKDGVVWYGLGSEQSWSEVSVHLPVCSESVNYVGTDCHILSTIPLKLS